LRARTWVTIGVAVLLVALAALVVFWQLPSRAPTGVPTSEGGLGRIVGRATTVSRPGRDGLPFLRVGKPGDSSATVYDIGVPVYVRMTSVLPVGRGRQLQLPLWLLNNSPYAARMGRPGPKLDWDIAAVASGQCELVVRQHDGALDLVSLRPVGQ